MFELIRETAFWIMIAGFAVMIIFRWVEAFRFEKFPLAKVLVCTIVIAVVLAATFYRKYGLTLPPNVWRPVINLAAVLLNLLLISAAFLVFIGTAPERRF